MSLADGIILICVLAAVIGGIGYSVYRKRRGKGCCSGGCAQCGGCTPDCPADARKTHNDSDIPPCQVENRDL